MPELDPFEARLQAQVHAFADHAATDVDAMAMAERTIPARRGGALAWLWHPLPVPVSTLLVLGLLLAVLAWSVFVGGRRDERTSVVPPPAPSAPAVVAPSPSPSPTPVPSTDGEGAEYVARLGSTGPIVTSTQVETKVGEVTQVREGVLTMSLAANDPRASGTGSLTYGDDLYASGVSAVGSAWGTLTLTNDTGAWTGPCTGGTWDERPGVVKSSDWSDTAYAWSCWLVGSGDHEGFTYYLHLIWRGPAASPVDFHGVIYPGAPPAP